jgi:hypothetical protein
LIGTVSAIMSACHSLAAGITGILLIMTSIKYAGEMVYIIDFHSAGSANPSDLGSSNSTD